MIVSHLSLRDFRNYAEAELDLSPGVNIFVGRNGQGKTNLVESLVFLSTLTSHRVSGDSPLVRAGCDAAIIRMTFSHGQRELLAEVQINSSGANRAQINRSAVRPRDVPWYVRTVIFAPEDLTLVRGEPSSRRRFIDQLAMSLAPRFSGVVADYERVVKQRNSLLKSLRGLRGSTAQTNTLEVWDAKLIQLGSQIVVRRAEIVERLREPIATAYQAIVDDDHRPSIELRSSVFPADGDASTRGDENHRNLLDVDAVGTAFREQLERERGAERDRGISLVGPHRDDLDFGLNALPVKGYASHGETWSFVLALKLAMADLLRHDSQLGDPVLILDDVFAELDRGRRERLAAAIHGYEQVLVTAAVPEDIPERLAARPTFIRAGRIVTEHDDEL